MHQLVEVLVQEFAEVLKRRPIHRHIEVPLDYVQTPTAGAGSDLFAKNANSGVLFCHSEVFDRSVANKTEFVVVKIKGAQGPGLLR
jgi:hypothetical protein